MRERRCIVLARVILEPIAARMAAHSIARGPLDLNRDAMRWKPKVKAIFPAGDEADFSLWFEPVEATVVCELFFAWAGGVRYSVSRHSGIIPSP